MSNEKFGQTDSRDRIYKMDCPNPKSEKSLAQQNYIKNQVNRRNIFIEKNGTFYKSISNIL